ncbi:MAG: hypothetical protein LQ346_002708 [Caloplaca aetnensis]|nr:MAG: hypothetical protein LQ346_002708 [Caloplaca aetnensis]
MKIPLRIHATITSSRSREPITYLSLVENPEVRTPSHRVHALSEFDLVFDLHQSQQQVKLTLKPNNDIIAQGATVTYLDNDGKVERAEPIKRLDYRVFRGESWIQSSDGSWLSAGWARITVERDGQDPLFEGAFTIGRDHHHILLRSTYLKTKHDLDPDLERGGDEFMIAYRDSDIFLGGANRYDELKRSVELGHSCSSDLLTFNTDPAHPVFAPAPKQQIVGPWASTPISSLFGKRQIDTNGIPSGGNSAGVNLRTTIGKAEGCPTTRRVALVGVATDCGYTASFDSEDEVRLNIIRQFQTASELYERTFSITLGLQNLTISKRDCPATPPADTPWNTGCGGSTTITDRLNMFSAWRGERSDTNAYWTLLTSCSTGSEVGLSWLGQLCVTDVMRATGEVVSGANVVAKTPNEWQMYLQYPVINVVTASSRMRRNVIAEARKAAATTSAVILALAGSDLQPYAMTPMRAAATDVNSRAPELSVEPAPGCVIPRRPAPATTQHVQPMSPLRMANLVATTCNVPADNAHPGISNAGP